VKHGDYNAENREGGVKHGDFNATNQEGGVKYGDFNAENKKGEFYAENLEADLHDKSNKPINVQDSMNLKDDAVAREGEHSKGFAFETYNSFLDKLARNDRQLGGHMEEHVCEKIFTEVRGDGWRCAGEKISSRPGNNFFTMSDVEKE
jgi:hypothetical protein